MRLLLVLLTLLPTMARAQFDFADMAWIGQSASGASENTLTNGLIAYWQMDALPTVVDRKGTNNLTDSNPGIVGVLNARSIVNGTMGYSTPARIFTCLIGGSGAYRLSHADNALLGLGADEDFTISVWVNGDGNAYPGGNYPVFVDKGCFYNNYGFVLYWAGGAGFKLIIGNGGGATNVVSSLGTSPDASTWYNVVGRYNSSQQKIYINVNGTNYQDAAAWTYGTSNNGDPFSVFAPSTGTTYTWTHLLDDVGYWKRCLTDAEVQKVYEYGLNGQGYPWPANWTQTNIVFFGDARFEAHGSFMPDVFSSNSTWTVSHAALTFNIIGATNVVPYDRTAAMYVQYPTDTQYQSMTNGYTYLQSFVGSHTQLVFVCESGVNDVIASHTAGDLVYGTLTNFFDRIKGNFTLVPMTSWGLTNGMDSDQTNSMIKINTFTNTYSGLAGYLDAAALLAVCPTCFVDVSEENLPGAIMLSTNLDAVLNNKVP